MPRTAGMSKTSTGPMATARTREHRCLRRALDAARAVTDQPSFIRLRTIIGWLRSCKPAAAHGAALGDEEVAATKKILGFDPTQGFEECPTRFSSTPAGCESVASRPKRPGSRAITNGPRPIRGPMRCTSG